MHCAIWKAATNGLASTMAFLGLFDQVQVVAFFIPYLMITEIILRWRGARRSRSLA